MNNIYDITTKKSINARQEIVLPEDFFIPGEIEGFYVEEHMRRAWAAQLKVLSIVDEVCRKHDIKYFLYYGSLLGAVRHKGFIPWDDDVDIAMLRPDYMKFLSIAKSQLPEHYCVYSIYHDPEFTYPSSTVNNRENVWEDKSITEEYFGCPFVVGMDIYPLDFLPKDPQEETLQKNLYIAAYDIALRLEEYQESGELFGLIKKLEGLTGIPIDMNGNINEQLWKLSDKILMMYSPEESEYVAAPDGIARHEDSRKSRLSNFDEVIHKEFNGLSLPVPKGYDEVLKDIYGEEYMTPARWNFHDYPFYKKQLEFLKQRGINL